MEITISGKDKKALQKVENLAKKLGLQIKNTQKGKTEKESRSEKLSDLLDEVAASGGVFSSIQDPVLWQREQRNDRILPEREER